MTGEKKKFINKYGTTIEIDRPARDILRKWNKYYEQKLQHYLTYADTIRCIDEMFEEQMRWMPRDVKK